MKVTKMFIPPVSLLNEKDKKQLLEDLGKLNFTLESLKTILSRVNKSFQQYIQTRDYIYQ